MGNHTVLHLSHGQVQRPSWRDTKHGGLDVGGVLQGCGALDAVVSERTREAQKECENNRKGFPGITQGGKSLPIHVATASFRGVL